jgi:hypothetical protein
MKIIFAGTPEFAATAMEALLAAGHEVALVLTQPDRPAGRGMALQASAVKKVALAHGIPVFQPERLKDPATHEPIRAACAERGAELMVVVAYGLILPQAVLDLPRRGCINIHASLLPRWRGAAPIHRSCKSQAVCCSWRCRGRGDAWLGGGGDRKKRTPLSTRPSRRPLPGPRKIQGAREWRAAQFPAPTRRAGGRRRSRTKLARWQHPRWWIARLRRATRAAGSRSSRPATAARR